MTPGRFPPPLARAWLCGLALLWPSWGWSFSAVQQGQAAAPSASTLALPLYFEAAHGESSCPRFVARNRDGVFRLSSTEAVITLREARAGSSPAASQALNEVSRCPVQTRTLRLQLLNAAPHAPLNGAGELPGKVNYFLGSDPAKWQENVPTFTQVRASGVYPGVDLVYYGNEQQLEYDFIVSPGANPAQISFRVLGADRLEIDPQGNLLLRLGASQLRQHRPVVYQLENGQRKLIAGGYRLKDGNTVAFDIGAYQPHLPLVIDPVLSYSTYFGGLKTEAGRAIALDAQRNIYLAGDTLSSELGTTNAFQPRYAGGYPRAGGDAFVAKFDSTGTNLLYMTYLGGNGDDAATALALDPQGNLYVTGVTDSTNFPIPAVSVRRQISGKGDFYLGLHRYDAFVAKLNPAGSELVYATYLGGSDQDQALSIAVDAAACAYVAGFTLSPDFPAKNAFQRALHGGSDAFVTKIASNGMSFVYSTYLGGSEAEHGYKVAVDSLGRAHVTGYTTSGNFPVSTNAFQAASGAPSVSQNAFVSILETNGTTLVRSTYLGGSSSSTGFALALDDAGNVYVTGSETGPGFAVTPGNLSPGGVFASTDAAASWFPSNAGLLNHQVAAIAVDPHTPSNLYAGTARGLQRSTDGGATWLPGLNTFSQVLTIAIDPLDPSIVYVGGQGILKSTNAGVSWFEATAPAAASATVTRLVVDPATPQTLYAGTTKGLFKSTDGANTWAKSAVVPAPRTVDVLDLLVNPASPATVYAATSRGLFRSTDSGTTWALFEEGLTNFFVADSATLFYGKQTNHLFSPTALGIDSTSTPTLYAGTAEGAVFKRADGAPFWVPVSNGLTPSNSVLKLVVDPVTPATVYAGAVHGLFKTTDGGASWAIADSGLPGLPVTALAINPVAPSILYVGAYGALGSADVFLTKLNPDLTSLVYSVVFGGGGTDQAFALAVDAAGNAFAAGATTSLDFPTFQPIGYPFSFNSGSNDVFVAALNSDASAFLYSTYLGGASDDMAFDIALDPDDNAYVVGQTFSPNFPTAGAFQAGGRGTTDAFLSKLQLASPLVNVTLATVPANVPVVVDGQTNATPFTFAWPAGSYHTLAALPQSAADGARYVWTGWSDNEAQVHTIRADASAVITASYKLQYLLTMVTTNLAVTDTNLAFNTTNSGALNPPGGFYDAGTSLTITATPPAEGTFESWAGSGPGSFSGTNNPASITLNGPITQTALFGGPLTNQLRIVINGKGTVTPNLDGRVLKVGRTFSVVATPAPGYVFAGWTTADRAVFARNERRLFFAMTSGLVLEANFVPNPLAPAQGRYAGLLLDTNFLQVSSSGAFSATVSKSGSLSGRVTLAGKTFPFSGQFARDGSFARSLKPAGLGRLTLVLQLDATSSRITGHLIHGTSLSDITANRAGFSSTNSPSQAGQKYTLVIPGAPESVTEPGGEGFGTVAVDTAGNVSFSGTLADGTAVSRKTFMSGEGQWPLYVSLYSGRGMLLGWLTFTNQPATDIAGTVDWFKLPHKGAAFYPEGFELESEVAASLYSFTNGAPVLPLNAGNGLFILENGNLPAPFLAGFTLDAQNRVTSTNGLSLRLDTASGLFSGSAFVPATNRTLTVRGALLQKQNRGAGFFHNDGQAGRAALLPAL